MQTVYIGTDIKLNINIEPIGDQHMSDFDFKVEAYCNPNKVLTISKEQAIPSFEEGDDGSSFADNYIIIVPTSDVGPGTLKCKITAYVTDPDLADFNEDAVRAEVAVYNTDIQIVK